MHMWANKCSFCRHLLLFQGQKCLLKLSYANKIWLLGWKTSIAHSCCWCQFFLAFACIWIIVGIVFGFEKFGNDIINYVLLKGIFLYTNLLESTTIGCWWGHVGGAQKRQWFTGDFCISPKTSDGLQLLREGAAICKLFLWTESDHRDDLDDGKDDRVPKKKWLFAKSHLIRWTAW